MPAVYEVQQSGEGETNPNLINLETNHTYFIMSDNGTYMKPDQENELRLKLVDAISKYNPSRDDSKHYIIHSAIT